MTTGKDYGLPAEYADWVEWTDDTMKVQDTIVVTVTENRLNPMGIPFYSSELLSRHVFVAPKPKPTLPEVKPGAVIRYTDKSGYLTRAVRIDKDSAHPWRTFTRYDGWLGDVEMDDDDLLADVNDTGFTVELEGL